MADRENDARVGAYRLRQGGRSVHLPDRELLVGRGIECDLVLDDPLVSRKHAVFRPRAGCYEVEDLKSKNGTQVMGETIKGPTVLNDGDEIEFGHVKGWYIVEAADDPPTTTHL